MIKSKLINKKFYNKWLYKITLNIQGISVIRMYEQDLTEILSEKKHPRYINSTLESAIKNKTLILDLLSVLNSYPKDIWGKRIERSNIDIYTNDLKIFQEISNKFQTCVLQRYEPSEKNLDLYDSTSIVVKKYPHKIYKHKVYLLPHKLNKDKELKKSFLSWVESNPRILISEAVKRWFITTDWNWDRRYVLVEDEQTLLMLKLRNSDVVGRIYNYKLSDK